AIASNAIAYLIPCHRVIQSSGQLGGYRWTPTRKTAIIGWEAAQGQ
ncbi:MGMT family protein, partial [Flagellimonas flava]